jgi:hypothetical protein
METNNLVIAAIDPGLTGAVAFYMPSQPGGVAVYDMPVMGSEVNPNALRALIESHHATHAIIERVGPMPRDGVMQAWRFSATFAVAKTVVALIGLSTTLVPASAWKRAMKVQGGPIGKEQCRTMAFQRFPQNAADFARKNDAGRAEAALLAIYAADLSEKKL